MAKKAGRKRAKKRKEPPQLFVRGVPRQEPDLRKLARVLIELANKELEAEQDRSDVGEDVDPSSKDAA